MIPLETPSSPHPSLRPEVVDHLAAPLVGTGHARDDDGVARLLDRLELGDRVAEHLGIVSRR